jgi:hypothetical protein
MENEHCGMGIREKRFSVVGRQKRTFKISETRR